MRDSLSSENDEFFNREAVLTNSHVSLLPILNRSPSSDTGSVALRIQGIATRSTVSFISWVCSVTE